MTVHEAGSDTNPYSYGYGNPTSNVDPDGRIALPVIGAFVGAIVNTAVYVYQNGFNPTSGSWWAGVGVAAGSGALGGLTGGAVGVAFGTLLGPAAGTLGGSVIIGMYSGAAGAGAAYGSSWLGLSAAKGLGANVSTAGFSLEGMGHAMAMGGLVGGAMGGAVWGGIQLYNSLANPVGNAGAAAQGKAAGQAANNASKSVGSTVADADDVAAAGQGAL